MKNPNSSTHLQDSNLVLTDACEFIKTMNCAEKLVDFRQDDFSIKTKVVPRI